MEINRISSIVDLKLGDFSSGITYSDYELTVSKHFLFTHLSAPAFVHSIGLQHFKSLENHPCFFSSKNYDPTENFTLLGYKGANTLKELIFFLWFIKDCSCNIFGHYTYIPSKKVTFCMEGLTNYSNCKCGFQEQIFTFDDFKKAGELMRQAHKLSSIVGSTNDDEIYNSLNDLTYKGLNLTPVANLNYSLRNRIERAILFLNTMRSVSFIPLKIGLGMNILECLFSADSAPGEITHKIAERVAFYIGQNAGQRQELFKLVKAAYSLRSKYFHGQELNKKDFSDEKLNTLTIDVDNLLRIILTKVITKDSAIFLLDQNSLNTWFTNLIFG